MRESEGGRIELKNPWAGAHRASRSLKFTARGRLSGQWKLVVGIEAILYVISWIVSFIFSSLVSTTSVGSWAVAEAIQLIINALLGMFTIGAVFVYMRIATMTADTRIVPEIKDILHAWKHEQQRGLPLCLIQAAIGVILTIPAEAASYYMGLQVNYIMGTLSGEVLTQPAFPAGRLILLYLVCLLVYVPVSLLFSQVYFILLDFPKKKVTEILKDSMALMGVYWKRMLYLEVSFIPLRLLGMLSIVGMLWVAPYMNETYVLFYLEMLHPDPQIEQQPGGGAA